MATTGMMRRVDDLGRVVIPKEIRDNLGINRGDALEISVDAGRISLTKVEPYCVFCRSDVDIIVHKEKNICKVCLNEFKNL